MTKNTTRIHYLDGLRGWAALVVCLFHTAVAFGYNTNIPNPSNFLLTIRQQYFKLLFDGNLSVKIFFVLSGIVLSISFIKNPASQKLAALLIKRIPRLSIPIFAMSLISHFLIKANLMFNLKASKVLGYEGILSSYYNFDSSIFRVFASSILLPFFGRGNDSGIWATSMLYSGVLWTMPHEMVGSIFVAIALFLSSFINKNKRFTSIIILFIGLIILSYQNAYFAGTLTCFLFGILLAYYLVNKNQKTTPPPPTTYISIGCKIILAILILWLYYNSFTIDIKRNLIAVLIVFLVIVSPYLQKILSNKVSIFLGKISFPLYLIHMPIICSLTSFLITKKYDPNNTTLILLYFSITLAASIIAAHILYPIEKFAVTFSHKVFHYFSSDKKLDLIEVKKFIEKIKNNILKIITKKSSKKF